MLKDILKSSLKEHEIPFNLPTNWKWYRWEDLIVDYQQGLIRSNRELIDTGIRYLKMNNLDNDGNYTTNDIAFTEISEDELDEYKLYKSDFLINVRNSKELVGKTCVIGSHNFEMVFNHMLVRIEHFEGIPSSYINALLKTPVMRKFIDRCKKGTTTVIALYQRDLYDIPIPIPDNLTLSNISSFIETISSKIELNNRINAELEAMAKTLYDYWFVQFDFPDADGKPYKTNGGTMVWNEDLKREIPEGWEVGELQDIANITMGQSPPGESYNEENQGMIFFQGCTDFGNRFPTVRQFTTQPTRFAKTGDILLSVRAPVGTLNIAKEYCCIGRGLSALNSKDNCISYLFGVMTNLKQIFDRRNTDGTTFGSITKDDLFSLKVLRPQEEFLKLYDKIINPTFEKQNKIEIENQTLATLRDWLLPMLMNGQVVVA